MRIEQLHDLFLKSDGISTDTRKVAKNVLFFALKGDNFNGNTFAKEALKKGASHVIIDEPQNIESENAILVNDVLKTLQDLATYHGDYLKIPIIALTGSNGKTTTKELINAVLSRKYNTVATKGNLNNHIGVPLTLLSMDEHTEIGIVEMGANHLEEIKALCAIAHPDFGYITNFGKAHLEGFGSIEGVIKGKTELYDFLMDETKYIFLNADDKTQKEKLNQYIKKFGFSQTDPEFYKIELMEANPFVKIAVEDKQIVSKLIGSYNFTNIAAAVLIGKYFNIALDEIKVAIQNYVPVNNRSQVIEKGTNQIILDAYNANPTSMKAALENFDGLSGKNKVVILGDMFELGDESTHEHQHIVDLIETIDFDHVYLIGENFHKTNTSTQHIKSFRTFDDFKTQLEAITESAILIKGSRGMALERTLDVI